VEPQCTDRVAAPSVTCACRFANPQGQTDDGVSYCTCPGGTTCSQVVPGVLSGGPLAGGYCVPAGSDYDASSACSATCVGGAAVCPTADAGLPTSANGASTTYFTTALELAPGLCAGSALPTTASGMAACQIFYLLPSASTCSSGPGLSVVDSSVAAAVLAGTNAPGPMTVCLLPQLLAAPCASSTQAGWCYLAGANATTTCPESIGMSPSVTLPTGSFAALACP
jgi:hypothetical protein